MLPMVEVIKSSTFLHPSVFEMIVFCMYAVCVCGVAMAAMWGVLIVSAGPD